MYNIGIAIHSDFFTNEELLANALFLPDGEITPDDGGTVKYNSFEECCLYEGVNLTEEQIESDFNARQEIIKDIGRGYYLAEDGRVYYKPAGRFDDVKFGVENLKNSENPLMYGYVKKKLGDIDYFLLPNLKLFNTAFHNCPFDDETLVYVLTCHN